MKRRYLSLSVAIMHLMVLHNSGMAAPPHGDFKIGYQAVDHDGNRSVFQPSFNLYDGALLSLENFSWQFDGGTRLTGNLQNAAFNNRNLTAQLSRPRLYSIAISHNQYRRVYSFDGAVFTKRRQTSSTVWVQPFPGVRLYGGVGLETKKGNGLELFEPSALPNLTNYDYDRTYFHGGFRLTRNRASLQAEYRGSTSNAEAASLAARDTRRYKITASGPVPTFQRLILHGGFQHYEWRTKGIVQKLSANTVWGGGRLAVYGGLSVKYSFAFDRSSYDFDPVATDNISHSLSAEQIWPQRAGLALGYMHRTNDNLVTEKSADAYRASGWVQLTPVVKLSAGYGAEREDLLEGATLTGPYDRTWYYAGLRFVRTDYQANLRIDSRTLESDEIGSNTDFTRVSGDISCRRNELGDLLLSYSFQRGDFENAETKFEFVDHVLTAEATTVYFRRVQSVVRGTYYRTRRDLNRESIVAGLTGRYRISSNLVVEAGYSSYTYDDLFITTAEYTRYYSGNVFEAKVIKSF